MRTSSLRLSPRSIGISHWTLCLLVIVGCVLQHIAAGFAMPAPWPDESSFLWQAIAFQRHNTLYAPELNPLRDVLWMPPGYMFVIGTLFKIFGVSFALARAVSLVCIIGSFILLAAILKKHPFPFISTALLGVAFLSSPMTAIGNTARMDSFLLFIASAGMYFFYRKRDYLALALISFTPLIHPNGLFLCAAALGYVVTTKSWRKNKGSSRYCWRNIIAAFLFCASIACWIAYIAYMTRNWSGFLADMARQFQHKGALADTLVSPGNLLFALVIGGIIWYGWKTKIISALLAWFGGAMWLLYGVSTEAWYECFYAVGFVLLFCASLPILIKFSHASFPAATQTVPRTNMRVRATALLIVTLAIVSYTSINFYKSFTGAPFTSWFGMHAEDSGVPYKNANDIAAVKQYLAGLQRTFNSNPLQPIQPRPRHLLVQFLPEADALFYSDMETDSMKYCQGTLYPFNPDIYIIHSSRYITAFLKNTIDSALTTIGVFHSDTISILTTRDSTESWLVIQRTKN